MKVSIIITCYNRESFIAKAIDSAIAQSFPSQEFEIIVVDDGSTDNSREIIAAFGPSVTTLYHHVNRGLPVARNTGIRHASGDLVVNLDSDDSMDVSLIQKEYDQIVSHPKWNGVSCDYVVVDGCNSLELSQHCALEKPIACGVMFSRRSLLDVGLYDERMHVCEDEELLQRYTRIYTIGHVHSALYSYTRHSGNLTNRIGTVDHFQRFLADRKSIGSLGWWPTRA